MTYENPQQHQIPRETPPKHNQGTHISKCITDAMTVHLFSAGAAHLEDELEQLRLPRFFAADENAVNHKVHHTREKYVSIRRAHIMK